MYTTRLYQGLYLYFALINIITFIYYGYDKKMAQLNKYRISEKLLLILSVIGGFLGGMSGMMIFKHKLSKKRFYITLPIIGVVYLLIFGLRLFQLI